MIHCVLFSALLLSVTGTPAPTFQPTNIPTSILEIPPASIPIAMHQLVVVENAGSSVIRFRSFDQNSFNVCTTTAFDASMLYYYMGLKVAKFV